jgi:glycosyltransferase involved in cell wall biosynthesis
VVQPAHGAFPEILEATGGGELFPPGDTTALAERLHALALDAPAAVRSGEAGARAVRERFSAAEMARQTRAVYERVLGERAA